MKPRGRIHQEALRQATESSLKDEAKEAQRKAKELREKVYDEGRNLLTGGEVLDLAIDLNGSRRNGVEKLILQGMLESQEILAFCHYLEGNDEDPDLNELVWRKFRVESPAQLARIVDETLGFVNSGEWEDHLQWQEHQRALRPFRTASKIIGIASLWLVLSTGDVRFDPQNQWNIPEWFRVPGKYTMQVVQALATPPSLHINNQPLTPTPAADQK